MISKIYSAAIIGLDCELVEVEADVSASLSNFVIVGLPDKAVDEARERVKSAIRNTGLPFPRTKITINLAPADIRKVGPAYDLPIALGVLATQEVIQAPLDDTLCVGELALNGTLRYTQGVLPVALFARDQNFKRLFVPEANAPEAGLVDGITVIPVRTLGDIVAHIQQKLAIKPYVRTTNQLVRHSSDIDFGYIAGQETAKRALEIASSGGHNVLLTGSPGAGKTLLARALPSILPEMDKEETLEVTKIYSVAGQLPHNQPLMSERPFRSPHHTSSGVALVGGGSFPRPGEISLAHRGVLFLDEFPEFPRSVLESLRQPLEDGMVTVSRAQQTVSFPAQFTLIASQNPCPCGYYSDPHKDCICTPTQIRRYQKKISGPLLDRIDVHVDVQPVAIDTLSREITEEPSKDIRKRVESARERQRTRFAHESFSTNAEMSSRNIQKYCALSDATMDILRNAAKTLHLSARSYHSVLKLARTIADLEESDHIVVDHITEALNYRPRQEE